MDSEAYSFRRGKLPVAGRPLLDFQPWVRAKGPGSLFTYESAVTCPLFAKVPSSKDVAQGGIGDCSYLAAILAILNLKEGPEIVLHMMRDLPPSMMSDESSVVVRLFDYNKKPHYLRVPRSIITSWLPDLLASQFHADIFPTLGAWPVFLEKALTAFDDKGFYSPSFATYGRIAGALGMRAFKLLLGIDAKSEEIPRQPAEWVVSDAESPLQKMIMLLCGAIDPVKDRALLATIFPNPNRMYAIWQTWLILHKGFLADLRHSVESRVGETVTIPSSSMLPTTIKVNAGKVFNASHLSAFITSYHARDIVPYIPLEFPGVVAAIAGYAQRVQALPGKRASGNYAQFQIDFFNLLKAKLLAQIPVVVSMDLQYIGTSSKIETGHSAGESKVKGLAAKHSYAVLDVLEIGGKRIVRLGNPWGQYGRAYLWQVTQGLATMSMAGGEKLTARLKAHSGDINQVPSSMTVEVEEGIFDLDLYDLTKRFREVSYCCSTPTLASYLS